MFPLSFLAVANLATAGQQAIWVRPDSMAEWKVSGTEIDSASDRLKLSLPSGTQIARSFRVQELGIELTTQPKFAADPVDWQILEIGSSALIFRRNGSDGEVALALGDSDPASLPIAIKLGDDGHSAEPLTVFFSRGGAITLTINKQTVNVPAAPLKGPLVEVVASAGASEPWTMEEVRVVLTTPDPLADDTDKTSETAASRGGNLAPGLFASSDPFDQFGGRDKEKAAGISEAQRKLAESANAARRSALEVFTPPSARPGRADAIRATAAQHQPR
jgi:hypothetical protein